MSFANKIAQAIPIRDRFTQQSEAEPWPVIVYEFLWLFSSGDNLTNHEKWNCLIHHQTKRPFKNCITLKLWTWAKKFFKLALYFFSPIITLQGKNHNSHFYHPEWISCKKNRSCNKHINYGKLQSPSVHTQETDSVPYIRKKAPLVLASDFSD